MASTGCRRGGRADQAQARPGGRGARAAAEYQDIFGKEKLLPRADGPRPVDRDPGPRRPHRDREEAEHPAGRHATTPTTARSPTPEAHELLLCIQTGKTLADADRFKFDGSGYYIKSPAEMYAINNSDIWQEGCRNSQLLIADRVDTAGMFEFVNLMPRFPIPEEFDSENALFAHTVWEGMAKRYPSGIDDTRRKQAEYEIGIITQIGLPGIHVELFTRH